MKPRQHKPIHDGARPRELLVVRAIAQLRALASADPRQPTKLGYGPSFTRVGTHYGRSSTADRRLRDLRLSQTDGGGLVVAIDQDHARRVRELLLRLTGEEPALAVSDEPDAVDQIAAFRSSDQRWIVAVRMISEGCDIPRLRNNDGTVRSEQRTSERTTEVKPLGQTRFSLA